MNKKLGVITFNKAVNYGAILQTFALHKTLNKLNINNEIINYNSEIHKNMNSYKYRYKKGIKKFIEFLFIRKSRNIRNRKFQLFLKDNVFLSNKEYDKNTVYDTNKIYSNFLVGSDQVWNLDKNGNDKNFFLDFVKNNKLKNSYASSTGYIKDIKLISKYLKKFNNISIRELDIKSKLENSLNKKVFCLLDPTFLLDKKEWNKYLIEPKKKNYILIYTLTKSKKIRSYAKKIKKETGLEIIEISVRAEKYFGIKKLSKLGIEEFLGYFKNASYVITNSFHGLAFSIIFEKEFFYSYHENKELGNNRLDTVLEVFNLKNREINLNKDLKDYDIINYKKINKIKKVEQNKSFDYLKNIEGV